MRLDYSAITESPLYPKYKKIFETTGNQRFKVILLFSTSIILVIFVASVIPILIALLVPAVVGIAVLYVFKSLTEGRKKWAELQQALTTFAETNSFTYQKAPYAQTAGANLPDTIMTLPFDAKLQTNSGYMQGTIYGLPFYYISGTVVLPQLIKSTSTPNNELTRSIIALCVTLPKNMPTLYIDTKRNNIYGFEVKATVINATQQYNLEGDFPKYYRVLAEKDDQINVLSILTPEVMQKLLEHTYFDIWLNDNRLMIFATGTPYEYFAGIPQVFRTTEMLLQEIDRIARATR